jgi:hypothetical protein
VVNTNPENLERVLAVLLKLPELRHRLGRAGRAYAETYQSYSAMAEVWKRIYRHVWRKEPLRLEETALFDQNRRARPFTEDPANPDFWPVPVHDMIDRIREIAIDPTFVDSDVRELLRPGRFRE